MDNKPVLRKTIDGGASWTTILNMGVDWNQGFYFLNANIGVAVDGSALLEQKMAVQHGHRSFVIIIQTFVVYI